MSIFFHRIIDVGGQRNQRQKWIHFFEGVTAVVFFASLSSFDELVEEDKSSVNCNLPYNARKIFLLLYNFLSFPLFRFVEDDEGSVRFNSALHFHLH